MARPQFSWYKRSGERLRRASSRWRVRVLIGAVLRWQHVEVGVDLTQALIGSGC
jgi:hypothetical protein